MNGDEPRPKRRRLSPAGNETHITSVDQLQNLLHFRQDVSTGTRNNVNLFKDFLVRISRNEDRNERSAQVNILRQYCDSQKSTLKDQVCFSDLLSTWSFAAQASNDSLLSAVPAALAQFFRTISGLLEFREFGIALCHDLLSREQIRLFEQGFGAPKQKEHLISPCIRLLTEVVSFDGGASAGSVFARRDLLYRKIDSFLTPTRNDEVDDLSNRRKPSLRRLTLRLLISNLKFLPDADSKADLLLNGKTLFLCLRHLRSDADDIVLDFLNVFENVVLDDNLQRPAQLRMLNVANLSALGDLYGYMQKTELEHELQAVEKVRKAVHAFLLKVCTIRGGVLRNQNGWYPLGFDVQQILYDEEDLIDLGLDSPDYADGYADRVPVVNEVLANFVHTLKPEGDILQSALVLKIFEAAPELVAEFFSRKPSMPPPRDDAQWRQHFAFLFSVVQLPIPSNYGWHGRLPSSLPPVSVIIESILPRPFDAATTSRLFRMRDDMMKLIGARLMSVALKKLSDITHLFTSVGADMEAWYLASERLRQTFIQRSPSHLDIVSAIKDGSVEDGNVRSTLLECLAAYYSNLPTFEGRGSFDTSSALVETLQQISNAQLEDEKLAAACDQLANLLLIAEGSPTTKWWHVAEKSILSPVTLMLRVCSDIEDFSSRQHVIRVLRKLFKTSGVLANGEFAVDALLKSLTRTKKWVPSDNTFTFLDNCLRRTIQQPIKYLDQIESIQQDVSDSNEVSLLACCVAEQWPFVLKDGDVEAIENIARWIVRFFSCLDAAGEGYRVLLQFQQDMIKAADGKPRKLLEKAIEKQRKEQISLNAGEKTEDAPALPTEKTTIIHPTKQFNLDDVIEKLQPFNNFLKGLERLDRAPVDTLIQTSLLPRLIDCLSSTDEETRRLTFHYLRSLLHTIESSDYSESQQLYLLLGELLETIRLADPTFTTPVPSLVISLSTLLLKILSDPSDKMYSKTNHFLNRGPSWSIPHLLSYWVDKILLSEPEDDDGQQLEHNRFMDLLLSGLRTKNDMELYRKSNVFERILSACLSPQCTRQVRRKILGVVYHAILVGGAETLVTRVGIRSWLEVVRVHDRDVCDALTRFVEERSDRDVLEKWENSRPGLRNTVVEQTM